MMAGPRLRIRTVRVIARHRVPGAASQCAPRLFTYSCTTISLWVGHRRKLSPPLVRLPCPFSRMNCRRSRATSTTCPSSFCKRYSYTAFRMTLLYVLTYPKLRLSSVWFVDFGGELLLLVLNCGRVFILRCVTRDATSLTLRTKNVP